MDEDWERVYARFCPKLANMAAIAEISSLQEWEDEWKVLEDDTLKFKVFFVTI